MRDIHDFAGRHLEQEEPEANRRPPLVRSRATHMSIYLDRRVQRAIKEIALERRSRLHDVLIEGVELVLAKYGRPGIRALTGEGTD